MANDVDTVDGSEIFAKLLLKIGNILNARTVDDHTILSQALDEINCLNYNFPVIKNATKAVLLINQCCSFIPTDDKYLVKKCSQLIWNFISKQNIKVEGRTLTVVVHWCLSGLKNGNKDIISDILKALEALLRNTEDEIYSLLDLVTKGIDCLIKNRQEECSPETILAALHCIEACTAVKPFDDILYLELCAEILMSQLAKKHNVSEDLVQIKVLQICLFGLQNIITQHRTYVRTQLGHLLGFVKTFMLYDIEGINFLPPQKLLPSTLSIPEQPTVTIEKKGGKLTKLRKQRSSGVHKKEKLDVVTPVFQNSGFSPAKAVLECNSGPGPNAALEDTLKMSDSDFSENEAAKPVNLTRIRGKVRLTALNLFYNILWNIDKSAFLSYWSSFIPEDSASGQHNLIICVLKDPSSKNRMAALNVLLLLLTNSKVFLSQAECSEKSTSFTPFSVVLGLTVTQLHNGLIVALNDRCIPVLIQVLKCFAALVQATSYHRMSRGLLSRIIKSIKQFIYNRDSCVQVTALIALGCVLASEPVLPETTEELLKLNPSHEKHPSDRGSSEKDDKNQQIDNIDFAEFSDSDTEEVTQCEVPWLLARCLENLGVILGEQNKVSGRRRRDGYVVPVPVKLESLQVISALSRNYFEVLIAPHICHITKALNISMKDKYSDIRLHGGKTIDSIGQAMNRFIINKATKYIIPFEYCLLFWQTLFNESLIDMLQSENVMLRAVACDCLGSIGTDIFEKLPRDKQIVCVTSLFSCTMDEEKHVKAAAVRALGMCISYPSCREDPGFVIDMAEATYHMLKDGNLLVRIKASWSLGNLSDSLVLNSKSPEGIEDIPEDLILKLLQISIESTSDHDKIKMNAVRSIGNLMQLFTDISMEKPKTIEITDKAFHVLVQNCSTGSNAKVRWNACYAIGNTLKNSSLYKNYSKRATDTKDWQAAVFNALTDNVVSYHNFKVRINAAVALSTPSHREHYGKFFFLVWSALLKALENSQNMDDFSEYKHRDHLVEQICISLGHLTTLLQADDLMQLHDTIQLYYDDFKTHTRKVLERILPENFTTLVSASDALTHLNSRTDLTSEQRSVVNYLTNIFVPEF